MEKYAPNKMELASRDVVSRAEQTEINEGRGFPDGTVALDITVVPRKRIHEALREIVLVGRDFAGVDIIREPIPIMPGMHYMMGGVKTDIWGRTNVPGLYAAGEAACVSVHGGNRLGANCLLDTLIFGRRSGEDAAERAKSTASARLHSVLATEQRSASPRSSSHQGRPPCLRQADLGATMDENVAVFRDEEASRRRSRRQAAEERPRTPTSTIAARSSTRTCSGLSSCRHARLAEWTACIRRTQREPRRTFPHRLPGAKR